ncbi:hypothetical protein, partial [Vibrio anguillarum]|uniref:hypothetical protein n=1 Tax=Vibrio anguillarum TaxID=55601 RepID=UPI001BE3D9CB
LLLSRLTSKPDIESYLSLRFELFLFSKRSHIHAEKSFLFLLEFLPIRLRVLRGSRNNRFYFWLMRCSFLSDIFFAHALALHGLAFYFVIIK